MGYIKPLSNAFVKKVELISIVFFSVNHFIFLGIQDANLQTKERIFKLVARLMNRTCSIYSATTIFLENYLF